MFKVLRQNFIKELLNIKSSYYKLFLLTLFPLVSFGLIISIFYSGVLRDIPIVVVDNDKSILSSKLLYNINNSPTIKIAYSVTSLKAATILLQSTKVYGIIVIPPHFYKDTLLQKQPKVTAMLNTQYIMIGKILTSALTSTVMQSAGEVEYLKTLRSLQNDDSTLHSISPITLQITPFFNTYQNYFLFLVSALLPSIWQIFIVVATLLAFGSIFKAQREKEFFYGENLSMRILGVLLPYTLTYLFIGILYLFYFYEVLSWQFQGSYIILILGMFLTVVAYQAIALLLFATSFDLTRSLSLGAFYTAPAFAFLGVTFPVYSMNSFALFWREILPISHYIELQISQANYGVSPFLEINKLLVLLSFWLVFIPVFLTFKKKMAQ